MTQDTLFRQGLLTRPEATTLMNEPLVRPNADILRELRFNPKNAAIIKTARLTEVFGANHRLRFMESNVRMAVVTPSIAGRNGYIYEEHLLVDVGAIARRTNLPTPTF